MQLSLSRALLGLPCLSVSSVIGRKANLACMRRAAWHEALVRTAKQGARHSDKCSSEKWGCPERSKGGAHICCARQIDVVNSHASSAHHLEAPLGSLKNLLGHLQDTRILDLRHCLQSQGW